MKKALITGITGQDGAYLAKHLLEKNYKVFGTFRRTSTPNFWRLENLGIFQKVNLIPADLLDMGSMIESIKVSDPDEIYNEDLCGTCTECIDQCPTDAIIEPYLLDSNKCISYLTIEHKGDIPDNKKDNLDNWIYGCDICQEVCPWNIKFESKTEDLHFYPREDIKNKNKIQDCKISRDEFNQIFKKSAVKRTKYEGLKRNVDLVK